MTRLLFATAIVVAFTASANAQRCPAGADAFQSCLPLDHRYGGPGTIQQSRPRMNPCVYNYVMGMRQRGDPRVTRLVAETKKRGGTVEGDAPDFVEVGEAGIAVDDAMRRQRRVQLVG
jgi:hypothetical protein